MDRRLLETTALEAFLPALETPAKISPYGVWHDIERTVLAMPGDTVACLELTGPTGPVYAEQVDPSRRPRYGTRPTPTAQE